MAEVRSGFQKLVGNGCVHPTEERGPGSIGGEGSILLLPYPYFIILNSLQQQRQRRSTPSFLNLISSPSPASLNCYHRLKRSLSNEPTHRFTYRPTDPPLRSTTTTSKPCPSGPFCIAHEEQK